MWSKLSHALKRPATTTTGGPDDDDSQGPNVLGSVYEQHPNLSVFHKTPSESTEVPFPSPSPPPSPSKSGRRSLRKRLSRNLFSDMDAVASSSPKLPLSIPKKVKSSLQSISTGSDISFNRPSPTESRQSQDTNRPSMESARPPVTPVVESRFGSLRSILKPNNTPGTGQSVRFFSRDAYKVISPEVSSSSDFDDPSLFNRLQKVSPPRRSVQELFGSASEPPAPKSPMGASSLMMAIPPPDLSNIFDLSEDKEVPTIPTSANEPLLDSAIEISDSEDSDSSLIIQDATEKLPPPREPILQPSPSIRTSVHDRSYSFSFGQTVFSPMVVPETSSTADASKSPNKFGSIPRNRALSDTVFHSMVHSPMSALHHSKPPEADINDVSTAVVALGSPEREKDPFAANATTYYTPGTMLPPSPPQINHQRTASREEDLIWSLRTQLALQSELCAQYEVDLSARDEVVQTLTVRLAESEKECDRRKSVVRTWRKKVSELEKCVRGLEEEVERSREESLERSWMDEASGEALRMLHRRIGDLEREKSEVEKREQAIKEELAQKGSEVERLKGELEKRNESDRELQDGIQAAQEEMERMGVPRQSAFLGEEQQGQLRAYFANKQSAVEQEERHRNEAAAWEEQRTKLLADTDTLREEQVDLQSRITDAHEDVVRKEEEMSVLRAELEAQWKNTEKMTEQIETITSERDALKVEFEELHERMSNMEIEWNENENKKNELESEIQEIWSAREDVEHERDELEAQLHAEQEHAQSLTRDLEEQENRISLLTQERQYANESVSKLQERLHQQEIEVTDHKKRVVEVENEMEDLRAEMTKSKREHSRTVDEQSRTLSDVIAREVEARAHMENMVKVKSESDVLQATMKERIKSLDEEIEKLRRQVHDLQQESADKDIKLAQAAKQRTQDKEDMQGLNIALDSKQQELELLKRKVATKTAVTTTPAAASKVPFRRESSIFGTPSVSRPPSVLSDASSSVHQRKLSDPPSTAAKGTLARSTRLNASVAPSATAKRAIEGSMGPPPTKRSSLFSSTASATPTRRPSVTRAASVTPTATAASRRVSASLEPSHLKKASISSRDSLKSASPNERDGKENRISPASAKPIRRPIKVPA